MPGSHHMGLTPRGSYDPERGQHPDLTPDGNVRLDAFLYADPAERDFNRQFREDPNFAVGFMDRVVDFQRQQPEFVQNMVAGETFAPDEGTYAGLRAYHQEVARLRGIEDSFNHGENTVVVRDHEIADMSLERYDQLFDAGGKPKPGVVLEHGNRSVRLDSGIDRFSLGENELRARDARYR